MSIKHDYKTEAGHKTHRQVRLHGLLVILLVLIGLFGALLAYISDDTLPRAVTTPTAQPAREPEAPGDGRTPPPVKPKYDFYEVLPERKIVIPREETSRNISDSAPKAASQWESNTRSSPAQTAVAKQTDGYVVQAGAFHSQADAERRKATIAFLGIPARIEQGVGSDGRVLHRVHIGPVQDTAEVKRLRQRLKESEIQSLAIRIR